MGGGQIAPVGKDKLMIYTSRAGDILIFDNNGKFVSKFNHKGQSGEEYNYMVKAFADAEKDEIFVVDAYKNKQMQVYSMKGKYKRTVATKDVEFSGRLALFGKDKIVCYQDPNSKNPFAKEKDPFKPTNLTFLDKETGEKQGVIELPNVEGVSSFCFFEYKGNRMMISGAPELLIETKEGIVVNEVTCDTVFILNKAQQLTPIVTRTPKVSPNDRPLKMLAVKALNKDAIYLEVTLNEFNAEVKGRFVRTVYQMQRADNKVFEYVLKNADNPSDKDLATLEEYTLLQAVDLIEALEAGKLKGKLKTIAEKLKEDDNPVLMKVTLK